MKKTTFIILALLLVILNSCFLGWAEYQKRIDNSREGRKRKREEMIGVPFEEAKRWTDLRNAISWGVAYGGKYLDEVRQYLDEGYDPNRCDGGEEGFSDKPPLHLVAKNHFSTWALIYLEKEIPDPPYDIEIFNLLVNAGADVNQWPYVWCRVHIRDNRGLDHAIRDAGRARYGAPPMTEEEITRDKDLALFHFVDDTNRVIEAFLKAGADPDKLGHPYPYSVEAIDRWISDEEASVYFAKGTRPINEAIKKGIRWESQVDLLLQYTTLDKDSLKAAKESKDPAMIEKITKLWNEQNGGR